MKGYIVISNSQGDQKFADRLKSDLGNAGIRVRSMGGQSGSDSKYAINVSQAIKQADSFIYIASASSVNSSTIRMEIATATRAGVEVIILALDDAGVRDALGKPSSMPKLDFRREYRKNCQCLIDHLTGKAEESDACADTPDLSRGYVFLSYAEADTPYMEEVKAFLSDKGFGYWEFQGGDRDYQANLGLELEKVLKDAVATLSILSPAWKASTWSMREFLYSQQVGKPVLLLRFEDVEPTLMIADMLYIDFVGDKSKGFQRLHREIKALFDQRGTSPTTKSE
jgi:hypothetical protein